MMNNTQFTISMAGLVFSVSCRYPATREFCSDYLTPGQGGLSISLDDASIQLEHSIHGTSGYSASETYLEQLALQRAIAEQLPLHRRLLFHGSCLALDGKAVLFTARSGTGKSTHTRLWRQVFGSRVAMVNDDKPFLSLSGDAVTAWGSPWQGKHDLGGNLSAPLKAVCILTRGSENHIVPVSAWEALPTLMQQTYRPRSADALRATLGLVTELAERIPVYRLTCNMDPEAAVVCARDLMNGENL